MKKRILIGVFCLCLWNSTFTQEKQNGELDKKHFCFYTKEINGQSIEITLMSDKNLLIEKLGRCKINDKKMQFRQYNNYMWEGLLIHTIPKIIQIQEKGQIKYVESQEEDIIQIIEVFTPSYKTSLGVVCGTTKNTVIKLYGTPYSSDEEKCITYFYSTESETWYLEFYIDSNIVTKMQIHRLD